MWRSLIALTWCSLAAAATLEDVFSWKSVEFDWPSDAAMEAALKSEAYTPDNNLPLGMAVWKDKVFVTVPRWKTGIASSLNYVPKNSTESSPKLIPYPDWESNTLPKDHGDATNKTIISTFRLRVDACDRLWVMDTGLGDILGSPKQYLPASIVVFNLTDNTLLRRIPFNATMVPESSFFANIIVDVTSDDCDKAFAYIPDLGSYGVVVYDWEMNETWRVTHNFFHFDPLAGEYKVGGVEFQWTDGVFSLALSSPDATGNRDAFFHALSSTKEFKVPTSVLQNMTVATDPHSYFMYKLVGERGPDTQASASFMDEKTDVLFMTQVNRNGIACWNIKKPLNPDNFVLFTNNDEKLIFPNDLTIDADGYLWVLSDRMPEFIYKSLNFTETNFRIMKIKISDAIVGTKCV